MSYLRFVSSVGLLVLGLALVFEGAAVAQFTCSSGCTNLEARHLGPSPGNSRDCVAYAENT